MDAEYVSHMGDDLMVVNSARVSFAKHATALEDSDERLIRYLAKHKHWTPFSHPQICLRIKAPIFVARQLFKHKIGMTENEISRRYVDDKPEFFFPVLRQRPDNGMKQGSKDEFPVNLEACEAVVLASQKYAETTYKFLLKQNVAPEQARMVLPQSMYTEWYWTGSLAAYARVCNLRLDPHAQLETQQIAEKISTIIRPLFPISWSALVD